MEGTVRLGSAPRAGASIRSRKFPLQSGHHQHPLLSAAEPFAGLDKIISSRGKGTSIGFAAQVSGPDDRRMGEIFREVEPEDLLKFRPDFPGIRGSCGPCFATLEDLDEGPALIQILSEPKNALVKAVSAAVSKWKMSSSHSRTRR